GLLGFVLLYVNVVIWAMLQGNTEPPEILTFSLSRIVLTAVFAFGLAAWVEENLYRGYWQPLLAEKMNIWLAIVVQAAVFSAAHVGYTWRLPDFGTLFTGGLILGWLRGRENSLIAPFLAHGLFWMMAAFIVVR
ncbi:MAG TPA: CPBP family intramembrane metalloprotease, partial [Anaerolineae bacterium]|nr:CPBP family intramembrane metalloprotease [Anaerolineae bacterium]